MHLSGWMPSANLLFTHPIFYIIGLWLAVWVLCHSTGLLLLLLGIYG